MDSSEDRKVDNKPYTEIISDWWDSGKKNPKKDQGGWDVILNEDKRILKELDWLNKSMAIDKKVDPRSEMKVRIRR